MVEGTASGVALIFVGEDGENMIAVAPGANQELTPSDIDRLPDSVFARATCCSVSLEIPLATATRALRRGFESGMCTILNPAPAPAIEGLAVNDLLSFVVVLTPNGLEALALAGMESSAASRARLDRFVVSA